MIKSGVEASSRTGTQSRMTKNSTESTLVTVASVPAQVTTKFTVEATSSHRPSEAAQETT